MSNDYLYDAPVVQDFLHKYVVTSNSLLETFTNLGALIKDSVIGKVIVLSVSHGTLKIRANSGLHIESELETLEGNLDTDFEISLMYQDITKVLDYDKTVQIEVAGVGVTFSNSMMTVTLRSALSDVEKTPRLVGNPLDVNLTTLSNSLRHLSKIGAITSVFSEYSTILMNDTYMQMKFPSIWIELNSKALKGLLTLDKAKVVMTFLSHRTEVSIFENNNYTVIVSGRQSLYIPKSQPPQTESVEDLLNSYNHVGEVRLEGAFQKLRDLMSISGKADSTVFIYEEGVRVEVKNEIVQTAISIGSTKDQTPIDKFTIRLEHFIAILPIIGTQCLLYRKGNVICLYTAYARILIATI